MRRDNRRNGGFVTTLFFHFLDQYRATAPPGFNPSAAVFSRALVSIMPNSLATAINWKPSAARRYADSTSGT
jgi:hypothetical protein